MTNDNQRPNRFCCSLSPSLFLLLLSTGTTTQQQRQPCCYYYFYHPPPSSAVDGYIDWFHLVFFFLLLLLLLYNLLRRRRCRRFLSSGRHKPITAIDEGFGQAWNKPPFKLSDAAFIGPPTTIRKRLYVIIRSSRSRTTLYRRMTTDCCQLPMGLDAAQNVNFVVRRRSSRAICDAISIFQLKSDCTWSAKTDKTKQDLVVHLSFSSSSAPSIQTLYGTLYCKSKATGEGREMHWILPFSSSSALHVQHRI